MIRCRFRINQCSLIFVLLALTDVDSFFNFKGTYVNIKCGYHLPGFLPYGANSICKISTIAIRRKSSPIFMQDVERVSSNKPIKLVREIPLDNLRQRSAEGNSGHGYTAVMIVPTGIGASIGGYAGDALPTARVLASVVDNLVTHPNVMNGASLYWPIPNALYTEGYTLDMFADGKWGLLPLHTGGHRIGLLLDKDMSDDLITRHLQAADAARATLVRTDTTAPALLPLPPLPPLLPSSPPRLPPRLLPSSPPRSPPPFPFPPDPAVGAGDRGERLLRDRRAGGGEAQHVPLGRVGGRGGQLPDAPPRRPPARRRGAVHRHRRRVPLPRRRPGGLRGPAVRPGSAGGRRVRVARREGDTRWRTARHEGLGAGV